MLYCEENEEYYSTVDDFAEDFMYNHSELFDALGIRPTRLWVASEEKKFILMQMKLLFWTLVPY